MSGSEGGRLLRCVLGCNNKEKYTTRSETKKMKVKRPSGTIHAGQKKPSGTALFAAPRLFPPKWLSGELQHRSPPTKSDERVFYSMILDKMLV